MASPAGSPAERFDLSSRVHVAGLSAGGIIVAVPADTHPDVFAPAGIRSVSPAGAAHDVSPAFAVMNGLSANGHGAGIPVIVCDRHH